jgi:hypothetical protein
LIKSGSQEKQSGGYYLIYWYMHVHSICRIDVFWRVSNILGCFESFGSDLNLLEVFRIFCEGFEIFWSVSNLLGVFRIFWDVSNLDLCDLNVSGVIWMFWVFRINCCTLIWILRFFVISAMHLFFEGCSAHMGHRINIID